MQTDFDIERENLKNKLTNEINDLTSQLKDAENKLAYSQEEVNELRIKNEELTIVIDELEVSSQKILEYEKRIALLGADLMNTKSLCGVIVKAKSKYGSPSKREILA